MDLETHPNDLAAKQAAANYASARYTIIALISVTIILVLSRSIVIDRSVSLPIPQALAIFRSIADRDSASHRGVSASDQSSRFIEPTVPLQQRPLTVVIPGPGGAGGVTTARAQIAHNNNHPAARTVKLINASAHCKEPRAALADEARTSSTKVLVPVDSVTVAPNTIKLKPHGTVIDWISDFPGEGIADHVCGTARVL